MKRVIPYILGSGAYIAGAGLTITSAWLITMASSQPPILTLSVAIVMVRFFGISRSIARYGERISSHKRVFDSLTYLRVKLFEAITSNPITLIRDFNSGSLVKRVVDDVERAQEYELRITLPHSAALISLCTGIVMGFWIRPESIFITIPASALLLFFIPIQVKKDCEKLSRDLERSEGRYATVVEQASHGIAEAQLYGYLGERLSRTKDIEIEICQIEKALAQRTQRFQFTFVLILGASVLGFSALAFNLTEKYEIPPVQITMLIFLPLVMFEAITAWYPNLFTVGKLLLAKSEIAELEATHVTTAGDGVELAAPISEIKVQNVRARWSAESDFMRPVTFSVVAGETLVIRGRSGSGKSTLAMALMGLLDYDGHIGVDGVELSTISNLSSHVSGAIQISHVFNTSVRENLKIASPTASDEQLFETLAIVELDTLVIQLPLGLDTIVGDLGRSLSGGELKRLNLARALLSPAQVLILDEPTEHLDSALAQRIQRRIVGLRQILIVITHDGWNEGTRSIYMER